MSNSESQPAHDVGVAAEYLLLTAGGVHFALPVMAVREILEPPVITHVPMAPAWFDGLANLRGQILPVMNLATKLNLKLTAGAARPVLIVVDIRSRQGVLQRGILVDTLGGIVEAQAEEIQSYDAIGVSIAREFITGLLPLQPNFSLLIDLERIYAGAEIPAQ